MQVFVSPKIIKRACTKKKAGSIKISRFIQIYFETNTRFGIRLLLLSTINFTNQRNGILHFAANGRLKIRLYLNKLGCL